MIVINKNIGVRLAPSLRSASMHEREQERPEISPRKVMSATDVRPIYCRYIFLLRLWTVFLHKYTYEVYGICTLRMELLDADSIGLGSARRSLLRAVPP